VIVLLFNFNNLIFFSLFIKIYGNSCSFGSIVLYWSRNIEESKNFHAKTLTQEAAKKKGFHQQPIEEEQEMRD